MVCGKCATGQKCLLGVDCVDGVCDAGTLTCGAPTCMDGVKNGAETDVDCGGPTCMDCAPGKLCGNPADCTSGVCSGNPLKCQAPTCMDGVKNQDETDVDCGGLVCGDCANGKSCNMDGDCVSAYCNALKLCAAPTCVDLAKNGMETDVDCGGAMCPKCIDGKTCSTGADCLGGFCLGPPVCASNANGCTLATATDLTGMANPTVTFTFPAYTPPCAKIHPGQSVTFSGSFGGHPLQEGAIVGGVPYPDPGPPITPTNAGTMATFAFPTAGTYPYYCLFHYGSGMKGAIFVVP